MENAILRHIEPPTVSFLIPVLNEDGTITELAERILSVTAGSSVEIIFIDDGSTDNSWKIISSLSMENSAIKGLRFRRNFGKARALSAGAEIAKAPIVITMDADLQDDPNEIPLFLEKLSEVYDIVSGWKKNRLDPLGKTIPSKIFNYFTRKISGVDLKDFNCGFKAAHTEVYRNIPLYGELHRYVPVLAHALGYKYVELPVLHHPRTVGKSKYGLERYVRGFIDLITVIAITRYGQRPAHLFGGIGVLVGVVSTAILFYLLIIKLTAGAAIGDRPLLIFGVLLAILSAQLITLGALAEVVINRTSGPDSKVLISAAVGVEK